MIAVSLACPKDPKNLLVKVVRALCSTEILSQQQLKCRPKNRNGISRRLERQCSSGPIKFCIFDIYRCTLMRSNCLGLSFINLYFLNFQYGIYCLHVILWVNTILFNINRWSLILLRSFRQSLKFCLHYNTKSIFQPIRFKLNHQSTRLVPGEKDCSIWVGDLTPDVDDLALYKFFAQRFNTCRTAKGESKHVSILFSKNFPYFFVIQLMV